MTIKSDSGNHFLSSRANNTTEALKGESNFEALKHGLGGGSQIENSSITELVELPSELEDSSKLTIAKKRILQ